MSLPLPRQFGGNTYSTASLHIRLKSIRHRMHVLQLQEWSKTQATFKGYLCKCKPTRRDTVDIGFDDAALRDLIITAARSPGAKSDRAAQLQEVYRDLASRQDIVRYLFKRRVFQPPDLETNESNGAGIQRLRKMHTKCITRPQVNFKCGSYSHIYRLQALVLLGSGGLGEN